MAIEYKLPFTGAEIKEKLNKIDDLSDIHNNINQLFDEKANKSGLTLGIHTDGLVYLFIDGSPHGNGLDIKADVVEGDVFGYVDENNTIMLNGALVEGTYTVKYEMDDGSVIEIGDLVLDSNTYYSVTNNLTNCTNSNGDTQAVGGKSYSATISANSGYELSSVVVTMGGSSVSVSGGNINIANVTGNIVITAVAEVTAPSYTNLLPLSVDASGNDFVGTNGEDGYKTGYRINSSGVEKAQSGVMCTGFMPYTSDADTIYIKGITLESSGSYNTIAFYDASKTHIKTLFISEVNAAFTLNGDVWTIIPNVQTLLNGVAFFRFSVGSITDATIVTVNQEII